MIVKGSRVKYVRQGTEQEKSTGWYPPAGTLGTVDYIDNNMISVKWDEGTKEGSWFCSSKYVKEVNII